MRRAVIWVVLFIALAGCLDPIAQRLRAGDVESPVWNVGDSWTYEITSDLYAATASVTVVVAGVTSASYSLGWPAGTDATLAMLNHVPALGPVRDDLAYDVHGKRFVPVEFPLEDGKKWETTWITTTIELTARRENGTWNVTNLGHEQDDGSLFEIRYDPAVRAITHFVRTGLDGRVRIEARLVDNATGYQGDVHVPGPIQVALLESRTAGTLSGMTPSAPNPAFTVPAGTDTLLVGCLAGGAPGQYHVEISSPTGVICQLNESIQPNDLQVRVQAVEASAEEGQWEARLAAVGAGSVTAEVLAYPLATVSLGGATNATG